MNDYKEPDIRVGTSAFTAAGWEGAFYPAGMQPRDFLTYYATKFNTVEVDSTFYRTPARSTVTGWANKTPPGFVFSLKIPQTITHEKCLEDCDEEFKTFVDTAEILGKEKLGPMLLQFPYFNRTRFKTGAEFLARLRPFLKKLPKDHQFAMEIRNKNWLDEHFVQLLREHHVALAVIDQAWMPGITELTSRLDPVTADFTYVRWLGDRKGIEEQTQDVGQDHRGSSPRSFALGGLLLPNHASRHQSVRLRQQSLRGLCACDRRVVLGALGKAPDEEPDTVCACGGYLSKMVNE